MEHLIDPARFSEMHWAMLLVICGVSMAVLIKGADWLVEGASGLAQRFGMSKVIVGATIVSLGTTSPEAAVSVMAAWGGNAGLALGNAVGSIIADTALIFGIGALMVELPADRFVLSRQGWVQFGSAVMLAGLCYGVWLLADAPGDARISQSMGVFFLALLAAYMAVSVRWSRQHPHGKPLITPDDVAAAADKMGVAPEAAKDMPHHAVGGLIAFILVGLVVVIISSHVVICTVSELAEQAGIDVMVISATLVAFGTSLPELMVGITSIRKGHPELLVGNVIGADVLNVLFVIGASALAKPLPIIAPAANVPEVFLYLHLPAMLVVLLLFRVYIFKAVKIGRFSKWMGWPMVGLYGAYLVANYWVSQ